MSPFAVITLGWALGWAATASFAAYAINHSDNLEPWARQRLKEGLPVVLVALLVTWPGMLTAAARGVIEGGSAKRRK